MTDPQPVTNKLWSHSCIEMAKCPWAWREHYVNQREEHPVYGFECGSAVHELLEAYQRELVAKKRETDLAFAEMIAGRTDDERAQWMFLRLVEEANFDPGSILGVEMWMTAELPDDLGTFRGRIDTVQKDESRGALVFTDFKSYSQWKPPPERCPAQGRRYAWLGDRQEGWDEYDIITVQFVYAQSNTAWVYDFPRPVSSREIVSAVQRINSITDWRPRPHDGCETCPYVMQEDGCKLVAFPDEWDDFAEQRAKIKRLRGEANALAKRQRAYVKRHGNQIVQDGDVEREVGNLPKTAYAVEDQRAVMKLALEQEGSSDVYAFSLPDSGCEKLVNRGYDGIDLIEKWGWGERAIPKPEPEPDPEPEADPEPAAEVEEPEADDGAPDPFTDQAPAETEDNEGGTDDE